MEQFLPVVSDEITVPKSYKKEETILEYVVGKLVKRIELKDKAEGQEEFKNELPF